ncbi:hypothetical protein [uncultured Gimesia sp.]|uniref:hypothetical protein n=1 Tax=uncultured Gimesia sp. TaxID=1678688 RepID=UPI00261EB844|nr:hypothetical protein [uncultured Gimesia sp.]
MLRQRIYEFVLLKDSLIKQLAVVAPAMPCEKQEQIFSFGLRDLLSFFKISNPVRPRGSIDIVGNQMNETEGCKYYPFWHDLLFQKQNERGAYWYPILFMISSD